MDCSQQIDLYEFLTEAELQHYYNAIKNELKITNATQFKYATDEDLKSISMSRPEIRRLRKYHEKHFPHGYLSKIKRFLHTPAAIVKRDDYQGSTAMAAASSSCSTGTANAIGVIANNSPNKAPNNKHIIPPDAISVNKQLGTGEFGIVQQGVWTNGTERIQVAIKCLCRERMQSNPMEFLKEAAIMHSIEHENIVRLYGVVLATDSLMLVTELAHLRSLLECLKDPGLRVSFLTVSTLCEFALQICNGMSYLENKRLIHRDLAARNILVFSKNKVKISDFGLSRALGVGKDYYKTNFNVNLKLPIAWCAPESINYLRFTNASDVWAFGVCLWEMFSYGFQPWAALTGLQILEAIDAPNYQRLEQPECCPREYYTLMMKCWQDDASKRPKFCEIYELLPDLKPEQLKAVCNCLEAKSKEHLIYRQNDIITVLDRNTGTPYWKGVLNSGKTGYFNPSNTVAYLEGLPSLNRDTFSRNTLDRSTKRKLRTEMISKPQNDFKHTGHVGIDGATFGDIAFLGSSQNYNHVPRQIVTPYKPSEDIEQTPLLLPPTPTSPDSLQTASGYFADDGHHSNSTLNPSFVPSAENTPKNFSNMNGQANTFEFPADCLNTNPFTTNEINSDATTNTILANNSNNLMKRKTNSRQQSESNGSSKTMGEETHEYHEISDDEAEKFDLGPSLLDEINSMFGSINANAASFNSSSTALNQKINETDASSTLANHKRNDLSDLTAKLIRKNSAGCSKKSKNSCGSVKPISVKDEKILNQAIEIANEISARSMCSLVSDMPPPSTQSPKRKFSFRFPHLGGGAAHPTTTVEKTQSNHPASSAGGSSSSNSSSHNHHLHSLSPNSKKKNFTEELQSIPDLQEIIGQEGREAYNSLIERKHNTGSCHFEKQNVAKTLPRRTTHFQTDSKQFVNAGLDGSNEEQELIIPPLENAPRPTTLPTRGSGYRCRKGEMLTAHAMNIRLGGKEEENGFQSTPTMPDNVSPCESPSYVTQTATYKFPENGDCNPLPVPPKDGKKHIQTNAKRHVRKYPLIIPTNGLQCTPREQQHNLEMHNASSTTTTQQKTGSLPAIRPFNIHNHQATEYENTNHSNAFENQRNYQNIKNSPDDSASLQFESILEADFNKDQVLHTPDVTDGFYNFSIQKEHYHKSKEVDYDPKQLTGLYVNEDELRNLDIDKNLSKLKQQENSSKISEQQHQSNRCKEGSNANLESSELVSNDEAKGLANTENSKPFKELKMQQAQPQPHAQNQTQEKQANYKSMNSINFNKSKANSNNNELAAHALFQKVRKSTDKALIASNSVSCEDLLDFANQKPKGRERGVDSDEVRIMLKVLGQDVTSERCLDSLEFINWDVHKAIKILKLQNSCSTANISIGESVKYLLQYDWDLFTAVRECNTTLQ